MSRIFKTVAAVTAVAAGGFLAASTADAGWGYYYASPSYHYHAPIYSGHYSGFYGGYYGSGYSGGFYGAPSYGYGYSTYYGPSYGGYASPGYGYYAPGYGYGGYPRGEVEYDVHTPFGKQEVEYRFHRNGTYSVDIDD